MGLYNRYLLPGLVHRACSAGHLHEERRTLVPQARGVVLEVGIGSGLNLPYYDASRVHEVHGVDPSVEMIARARAAAERVKVPVALLPASAEKLPMDRRRFDTVVVTCALCTIADPSAALREIARVLREDGCLLFCEHGLAPDAGVQRWQRRLNPLWRPFSGGCHLDRDIPALLRENGFEITTMASSYLPTWRPASFTYRGAAVLAR